MKPDGSDRRELSEDIDFLVNIGPDEREAVLWRAGKGLSLLSLADGGAERPLCTCGLGPIYPDSPSASWSADGKTAFLAGSGRTTLIPWRNVDALPTATVLTLADLAKVPGAREVPERSTAPGHTSARYAFVRQAQQSNLYRLRLP
jgi:hypothetical protein